MQRLLRIRNCSKSRGRFRFSFLSFGCDVICSHLTLVCIVFAPGASTNPRRSTLIDPESSVIITLSDFVANLRSCGLNIAERNFRMRWKWDHVLIIFQLVGLLKSTKRRSTTVRKNDWVCVSEEQKGCNEVVLDYFLASTHNETSCMLHKSGYSSDALVAE